ncbi:MAG: MBL fold metallo-hydrolase [Longimicrobiales bacterium]
MLKGFALAAALLALLAAAVLSQRQAIGVVLLQATASGEYRPQLADAPMAPGGVPFGSDAHFVVIQLSENTFAIAEPSAWSKNFNYLLLGSDRSLLFDAGIGEYDIRPVVAHLTDRPMTFMPSHFHYDHTGQGSFERVVMVDLPHIREQADGNTLTLTQAQHLGVLEGTPLPTWEVTEWVKPGEVIDLGGRPITLVYTPGHTDNSVSLWDQEHRMLFTGDYIESGPTNMLSHAPTGNMGDYLQTAVKMLGILEPVPETPMYAAHGWADGSDGGEVPVMWIDDVQVLHAQLMRIRDGELEPSSGSYPVIYVLGNDMFLEAEPRWLQDWEPTHPER